MKRIIEIGGIGVASKNLKDEIRRGNVIFDPDGGTNGGQLIDDKHKTTSFDWWDLGNESLTELLDIDWIKLREEKEQLKPDSYLYELVSRIEEAAVEDFEEKMEDYVARMESKD